MGLYLMDARFGQRAGNLLDVLQVHTNNGAAHLDGDSYLTGTNPIRRVVGL